MNTKELIFVEKIKPLYKKAGYGLIVKEDKSLLELYFKKSKQPNMLIKVIDGYGDLGLIRATLEYFEDGAFVCKQYKAIF